MSDSENIVEEVLTLRAVVKLGFVLGAGVGVLMIPIMYFLYRSDLGVIEILMMPLISPLLNALTVALYAFVGYPLYFYLARKKKFNLHKLLIRREWQSQLL